MINKDYGNIENGNIKFAKNPLWVEDKMIANPPKETYIANDYKPIQYTETPQKDGYYFTSTFEELDNAIIQVWEEHEILEEINE